MKAIRIGFFVGGLTMVCGLLVVLTAPALATQWESLGNNVWGGTTDPAQEHLYQLFGWLAIGFGLYLTAITFSRWLAYSHRLDWAQTRHTVHRIRD